MFVVMEWFPATGGSGRARRGPAADEGGRDGGEEVVHEGLVSDSSFSWLSFILLSLLGPTRSDS